MRAEADCETESPIAAMILWIWLGAGLVSLLMFPGLRRHQPLLGWLPFWLVLAPLVDLAILRRARLWRVLMRLGHRLIRRGFAGTRRQAIRRHARRAVTWRRRRLMPGERGNFAAQSSRDAAAGTQTARQAFRGDSR